MRQIEFHHEQMIAHFKAGRMASSRWHCRVWTRLVAEQRLINGGMDRPIQQADSCPACTPSPYQDGNAQGEARQEKPVELL